VDFVRLQSFWTRPCFGEWICSCSQVSGGRHLSLLGPL
jgi:hypothetical protein